MTDAGPEHLRKAYAAAFPQTHRRHAGIEGADKEVLVFWIDVPLRVFHDKLPDTLPVEEYEFLVDYEGEGNPISSAELKEALSTLTPPDAQIILLSIIGGFTSYELGVIYNMTPGAVRTRQKRALEKLRNILA